MTKVRTIDCPAVNGDSEYSTESVVIQRNMDGSGRTKRGRVSRMWWLPVALTLVVSGCTSSNDNRASVTEVPDAVAAGDRLAPQPLADKATLKIAIAKIAAYSDIVVAKAKGEFEKENLNVEVEYLSQADSLLLLSQGKIDVVGTATTGGLFNVVGQGADIRLVMPTQDVSPEARQTGFFYNKDVINPDGGELEATDFAGKKVLTPSGDASVGAAYLYRYLTSLPKGDELKVEDMTFEAQADESTVASAIMAGAVGAGKVTAPNNGRLVGQECCELLDVVVVQSSEGGAYAFGPSMHERADVGAAFVRAIARTRTEFLFGDAAKSPEVNAIIAEGLQVDPIALSKLPPVYYDPNFGLDIDVNLGTQDFYRARGLLKFDEKLTADRLYDLRYLNSIGHDGNG